MEITGFSNDQPKKKLLTEFRIGYELILKRTNREGHSGFYFVLFLGIMNRRFENYDFRFREAGRSCAYISLAISKPGRDRL